MDSNAVREEELAGFVELKIGQEWETSGVGERLIRQHYLRSLLQLIGEEIETGDEAVDEFYRRTAPEMPTQHDEEVGAGEAVESLIMRFVDGVVVKKDSKLSIEFRAGLRV